MHITFRQLQIFAEVARQGSSQRAATVLHITPPAVSMQLRELEAQVGLPLFDREGRKLTLSTAGEYFLVHAKRMLAALKDAEGFMTSFRQLDRGKLTIGMVSTAKYFVPQLLARFQEEHPGIEVRLCVAPNREQLVAMMKEGEIDLSVMGRPPREIATRAEPFAAHPLVFICPPGHPLLKVGHLPVEALAPYSFIAREQGSGTRAALDRFFAEYHVEPNITMELPSNETIKQSVMAGLGLSLLSLHTIGLELKHQLLHVLDIEHTPLMRSWFVVRMQARQLSPAAEAFRYFIIQHGESHLLTHDAPLLGISRPGPQA